MIEQIKSALGLEPVLKGSRALVRLLVHRVATTPRRTPASGPAAWPRLEPRALVSRPRVPCSACLARIPSFRLQVAARSELGMDSAPDQAAI